MSYFSTGDDDVAARTSFDDRSGNSSSRDLYRMYRGIRRKPHTPSRSEVLVACEELAELGEQFSSEWLGENVRNLVFCADV